MKVDAVTNIEESPLAEFYKTIRAKDRPVKEPPGQPLPEKDPDPDVPARREPPNPKPPAEEPPVPPAEKPPVEEPPSEEVNARFQHS